MIQYNSQFGLPFNIIWSKVFQYNVQFGLSFHIFILYSYSVIRVVVCILIILLVYIVGITVLYRELLCDFCLWSVLLFQRLNNCTVL